jgi:hypothetical protein
MEKGTALALALGIGVIAAVVAGIVVLEVAKARGAATLDGDGSLKLLAIIALLAIGAGWAVADLAYRRFRR